jgi:hypothetical protein
MKRFILPGLALVISGVAICVSIHRGHAQLPDANGVPSAVLKQSWETGPATPRAPAAAPQSPHVMSLFNSPSGANPTAPNYAPGIVHPAASHDYQLPQWQPPPDPNQDIAVTPQQGPWMIFIETYVGEEAAQLARQLVIELRGTYKLHAYVHNHGIEEMRKEFERRREIRQKQLQFLKERNLPSNTPLPVRGIRVQEQYAVLVGGYRDDQEAKRALGHIRGLQPLDPKKIRLSTKFYGEGDGPDQLKGEQVYINPFKRAFVGRNPTVKTERPADWDKLDRAVLERLNRDESFNLLKCPKPVTLIIKQLRTPTLIQPKTASGKFLDHLGFGGKSTERVDAAAHNAHNLADVLRKMNIEAYVLHTRYASIVTVGAFDRMDDPAVRSMQHYVETLRPHLQQLDLLPNPVPWDYRAAMTGS